MLAEITGLNRTTITRMVRELIEHKFVREVGLQSSNTGRPSILLELNPDAGYILSAQIAANYIAVMCSKLVPDVIWRRHERIHPEMGQRAILDRLLALLSEADAAGRSRLGNRLGLAIGVPGAVDQTTGTALFAHNLGWKNVPLRDLLEQAFGRPVLVENDMNTALLGEYYFGTAQEHHQVLYISAGVGLGGGMIHNGQLFRGANGYANEFGHMVMDPGGELCSCGVRGCWETQASEKALFQLIRQAVAAGRPCALADRLSADAGDLTVQQVVAAAEQGDAVARQALAEIGRNLAAGIASLVNALDPEIVVLGDMFSTAGELLLPIVNAELAQRAQQLNRPPTPVVLGRNQADACLLGGVALVSQSIMAAADNFMNRA